MEDFLLNPAAWQQLGSVSGIVVLGVFVWLVMQRQRDHASDFKGKVREMDEKLENVNAELAATKAHNQGGFDALMLQNTHFQAHFLETRPTRDEINRSLDQMKESLREILQPIQQDTAMIKNWIMNSKDQ